VDGTTGADGETTVDGTTGADGETGVDGTTGVDGETGVDGTTGVDNETDVHGTTGADGKTGSPTDSSDVTPTPVEVAWSTTEPRAALVHGTRSFPQEPNGALVSARRRGSSSTRAAEANAVAPPVMAGARIHLGDPTAPVPGRKRWSGLLIQYRELRYICQVDESLSKYQLDI